MAIRRAEVVQVFEGGLRVRMLDERCRDCQLGCGGRCSLILTDQALFPEVEIKLKPNHRVESGQRVCVILSDRYLLTEALRGYGRPLLGLLIGAVVGAWLGSKIGHENVFSILAGAAGLMIGLFFSREPSKQELSICERGQCEICQLEEVQQ